MNIQIGQIKDFSNVDGSENPAFHTACLTKIAGLDSTKRYKLTSFEMQALRPGQRVLDAGCGSGVDLADLAQRVAPGGQVVGVDLSEHLLASARARVESAGSVCAAVRLDKQDFRSLSYPDNSFDAVRIDRCLQHVTDGEAVIKELARVLRPGGRLVAIDPDLGSLRIAHSDPALTDAILHAYRRQYRGPEQALHLREYFVRAKLTQIETTGDVLLIDSLKEADSIFRLVQCAKGLLGGLLTAEQLKSWVGELARRQRAGEFLLSLTRLIVAGTKPAVV